MSSFKSSIEKLDSLIYKLETNLGKAHKAPLAQKLGLTLNLAQSAKAQHQAGEGENAQKSDNSAFYQLDIRIGKIEECQIHEKADKLYCEKINIGTEIRNIASGLRKNIPLDKMNGQVLVAVNLEPKSLCGFMSNGMIVCAADSKKKTSVELIRPTDAETLGERVFLEGDSEALSKEAPKILDFKLLGAMMDQFKIDGEGNIMFKDKKLRTKKGYLQASVFKNGIVC